MYPFGYGLWGIDPVERRCGRAVRERPEQNRHRSADGGQGNTVRRRSTMHHRPGFEQGDRLVDIPADRVSRSSLPGCVGQLRGHRRG
jgi:hypothetical protein